MFEKCKSVIAEPKELNRIVRRARYAISSRIKLGRMAKIAAILTAIFIMLSGILWLANDSLKWLSTGFTVLLFILYLILQSRDP